MKPVRYDGGALVCEEVGLADIAAKTGTPCYVYSAVQYASEAYVAVLFKHLIIGSMSRKGYPDDNAFCESFMRTLKEEEIYCSTYADIEDLRKNLTYFLEVYYPLTRLHSARGYRTPAEFEAGFLHPNWGS